MTSPRLVFARPKRLATIMLSSLAISLVAASAFAQARTVGQIDTARGVDQPGDAVVTRASGETTSARSLMHLYDGDRVIVAGAATRLTLFVAGAETAIPVTRQNSPYLVRGQGGGASSGFVGQMLTSLDLLFNRPRMAIATATEVRGLDGTLGSNPFLPRVPQRLPEGARRLAILWTGSSSPVQVRQAGQAWDWAASPLTSTLIEAPAAGAFEVVLPGQALGWSVTRVAPDEFPRAPGLTGMDELTPDERLANAIWLLKDGSTEWRLFALSEVVDLAQSDYGAARLLAAIRSGEIEPWDLNAEAR